MKKQLCAAAAVVGVIALVVIISVICVFRDGLFHDMPPGWTLVTDGERYTIQEPDGYVWQTATWGWSVLAKAQAWFCYRKDREEAKAVMRVWVPVDGSQR